MSQKNTKLSVLSSGDEPCLSCSLFLTSWQTIWIAILVEVSEEKQPQCRGSSQAGLTQHAKQISGSADRCSCTPKSGWEVFAVGSFWMFAVWVHGTFSSKKMCFWTNSIISVFEVHQNGHIKTLPIIRGKPSWPSWTGVFWSLDIMNLNSARNCLVCLLTLKMLCNLSVRSVWVP